ncbi:MAG: MGMT family protein [Chloroflexi bacterium]|nr:MGMT family protein [Chloroflexota bacterium]
MKTRKSWREKLVKENERKVVDDPRGRGRMLVPRPADIDATIRLIEKGKLATLEQVGKRLARDYGADLTCPLCAGISWRIAAKVAEEDISAGVKDVTPCWRVVKSDGGLNEKFPGGPEAQAARLIKEGHAIEPSKGRKPPKVKNFQKVLQELENLEVNVKC